MRDSVAARRARLAAGTIPTQAELLKLWGILRGELDLWLGRLHRRHQIQTEQTLDETLEAHASIIQTFQSQPPSDCERVIHKHVQGWSEWLPTLEVQP